MERYKNCREMLMVAPNAPAVRAIMQDYLRSIAPLLSALPPECQRVLEGDVDIHDAAVTLLRTELRFKGSDEAAEFLHELAHSFASAAVRLTLLHKVPIAPS